MTGETIELFYLDEEAFMVPLAPPASLALRYFKSARDNGIDYALTELLENLLGEDRYERLINSEVSVEEYTAICLAAQRLLFGTLEASKKG